MVRLQLGPPPGIGPSSQQQGPEVKKKPTTRKKTLPPPTTSKQQSADFLKATKAKLTGTGGLQHRMQQRTADYYALQEKGIDPSWSTMDSMQLARDADVKNQVGGPPGTTLSRKFGVSYQDPSDHTTWDGYKSLETDFDGLDLGLDLPLGLTEGQKNLELTNQKIAEHYKQSEWQGFTAEHFDSIDALNLVQGTVGDDFSPYRQPMRENFDPALGHIPENMEEARGAQIWLHTTQKRMAGIVWQDAHQVTRPIINPGTPLASGGGTDYIPGQWVRVSMPDGTPVPTDGLGKPILEVSSDDIQTLELMRDMEAEIAEVRTADMEFRTQQKQSAQTAIYNAKQAQLESQLAFNLQGAKSQSDWNQIQQKHRNELDELDFQRSASERLAELQNTFSKDLANTETTLALEIAANQQEFQREQSRLDRSIQYQEYQEGVRASQATERLRQQEIDLQQQQFQLSLFISLAQSPEILYFLKNAGALEAFGDIMGDGGQAIDAIVGTVAEQQTSGGMGPGMDINNIQQLSQLPADEQARHLYALSAQTGSKDSIGIMRGSAPMAVTNPVGANAPLLGGAPPTSMTVSNRGSTASTPLSMGDGGPRLQSPTAPTGPSLGVRLQGEGEEIPTIPNRPTAAMGQMEEIVKEYQEGRYSVVDGVRALEDIALKSPFTEDTWEMLVRLTMSMTNETYSIAAQRIMEGPIGEWRHYGSQARGN